MRPSKTRFREREPTITGATFQPAGSVTPPGAYARWAARERAIVQRMKVTLYDRDMKNVDGPLREAGGFELIDGVAVPFGNLDLPFFEDVLIGDKFLTAKDGAKYIHAVAVMFHRSTTTVVKLTE